MNEYTCPACHRKMPATNQLVHSARCSGIPPTTTATTESGEEERERSLGFPIDVPIVPIVSDRREEEEKEGEADFGVCRLCSYHNTTTTTSRCTMCDTPFLPLRERHHTHNGGWSCQLCTYENPPSNPECVMCSNSRPSDLVYSDRLIIEENDEPGWCRILNENERRNGNRERQPSSTPNSDVSTNTAAARGAVLGALGGAALAYLNNRSVSQGAIGGAALGALLSLSSSNEPNDGMEGQNGRVQRSITTTTTTLPHGNRTFHEMERMMANVHQQHVVFDEMERMLANVHQQHGSFFDGTDGLSYEDLLARFGNGNIQRSATEETINSLPTRTFTDTQHTSATSSVDGSCLICLEQFREGTIVKTLPCLHQFCCDCVNTWLRQNASCPICKTAL